MHILLASASPRRQMLLERVGYRVTVRPVSCEEHLPSGADGAEAAIAVAEQKALALLRADREEGGRPVPSVALTADTVVWFPGEAPMGKPEDAADALRILRRLSGRTHRVSTAYCIIDRPARTIRIRACVTTSVRFFPLEAEDIEAYLQTDEPWDKAGAYGLQGGGALLVEAFDGSWDAVVGLPVAHVARSLRDAGLQKGLFPASSTVEP